jgi:hypothetical protein
MEEKPGLLGKLGTVQTSVNIDKQGITNLVIGLVILAVIVILVIRVTKKI